MDTISINKDLISINVDTDTNNDDKSIIVKTNQTTSKIIGNMRFFGAGFVIHNCPTGLILTLITNLFISLFAIIQM